MGKNSKIEWTDHTFNPWWGCTKVSPACDHCYACKVDARRHGRGEKHWGPEAPRKMASEATWKGPVKWNRKAEAEGLRARVFCGSMCDVFEDRDDVGESRKRLFRLIGKTPNLTWMLLTKRAGLMAARWFLAESIGVRHPSNIWLGVTAENQAMADERVPLLLATPAAVRFVSMEPLLGPVRLRKTWLRHLGWVIAGSESGPNRRPAKEDWFRSLRDQCVAAGAPFFLKQTEERTGFRIQKMPCLDGRQWAQMPGD